MRALPLVLVLALMGGALPAGCVEDVRFDPSGCDVHVRGRWLVDGDDPSAETCGNIALVELAIIDEPEEEFWIPPEFTVRCDGDDGNVAIIDGGAYIDTRVNTRGRCGGSGEILRDPPTLEYKSRWRGATDKRFVVDCTPIETTAITPDMDGGMILDLGTINLMTQDGGAVCPEP